MRLYRSSTEVLSWAISDANRKMQAVWFWKNVATISTSRWLFPNPRVLVSGSPRVDVCLMRKGSAEFLHLINPEGPHDQEGVNVFDEVPNIGPLEIRLAPQHEIVAQITQLPENVPLPFTVEGTHLVVTLPKLHLHAILEIRYQL